VSLEVGGVNHHSPLFAVFGSQTYHHLREDTFVAPTLPTVVQRLVRTRRSSTRGLPWDLGKKGSRRAICASVNQKRSDMFTARFQTVKHAMRRKAMGPDPNIPAEGRLVIMPTRHGD